MEDSLKTDTIKEGKAEISSVAGTFYNPVQEFNRDISIAALTVFANEDSDGIKIIEPLAATGLRSIRYALEVPNVKLIHANDRCYKAVQAMRANAGRNKVEDLMEIHNEDAIWLMQKLKHNGETVQVVDLDPYGCPTRFLDAAINILTDGGLLMITCTDMAVICGNTPETCYVKYGAVSLRTPCCHEMALRIVLQYAANHCSTYGKYIIPLLSLSADFYTRVFVKVMNSPKGCKDISSNISMVFQCTGCGMLSLHPLITTERRETRVKYAVTKGLPMENTCQFCQYRHRMGGPVWSGKLHDAAFVKKMLDFVKTCHLETKKRLQGMLTVVSEELEDAPLYYTLDSLCNKMHCTTVPLMQFRYALLNGNYNVSSSHCKENSVKTNAPPSVIWDIIKKWTESHPISDKRLKDPITNALIQRQATFQANFTYVENSRPISEIEGLVRFQHNPKPNWGPGVRSKTNILLNQKSKQNQNRHKNKRKGEERESCKKIRQDEDKKEISEGDIL